MKKHEFVLVLSGISEITPELADAVYSATGGDIEFNMRDGVPFIEFQRKAASLHEAITAAIAQVENAADSLRVVRVESESANVIAKINAELLGAASAG
jgi:uncharacterized protein YdhG (YjbR/CyaY superfamily)